MKNYIFIYEDDDSNELKRTQLPCSDDHEAGSVSEKLFAECNIVDCSNVYFLD